MYLFVGNLPPDVTPLELARLFSGFKHSGFRVEEHDLGGGRTLCYAVGRLDSERAAQKAIKKLNGSRLRETPIVVREFSRRSASNERRALGWRRIFWRGPERRQGERRTPERRMQEDPLGLRIGHFAAFRNGSLF